MSPRLNSVLLLLAGVLLGAYGVYCWWPKPQPRVFPFAGAVACPDHSSFDVWKGTPDSGTPVGGTTKVALAGESALIPEYHDCQRLIDGGNHFGPLAGIWVPPLYLPSIGDSTAPGVAVPAAVIHAWDGAYPQLGITQGWNCLYLMAGASPGTYTAEMVSVPTDTDCQGSKPAGSLGGFPLAVDTLQGEGLSAGDYPPVGRWDREKSGKSNYIGFSCGAAWCEVHSRKITHATSHRYHREPGADPRLRRIFEVKGWYDEQNLADGSTGSFQSLPEVGTIVPDPAIATLTVADYSGTWHTVATTSIRKKSTTYWKKMLLGDAPLPSGTPPAKLTESALCRSGINPATGASASCEGVPVNLPASCDWNTLPQDHPEYGWFVRLGDPQDPKSALYKCGIRHEHKGFEIPATARWMWLDRDETQWYRCDQGCCALKP